MRVGQESRGLGEVYKSRQPTPTTIIHRPNFQNIHNVWIGALPSGLPPIPFHSSMLCRCQLSSITSDFTGASFLQCRPRLAAASSELFLIPL